MVIVCNPGQVLSQKTNEDFEKERKLQQKLEKKGVNPFLLVLDSLSSSHSNALNKIRKYLEVITSNFSYPVGPVKLPIHELSYY